VLIRKGFRFRVYLLPEQDERARRWENASRFLWNLALEQRLLGLARPKDERVYPTAFDQINEMTALRAEMPWLADVPRNVCAQVLVDLDLAFQRCFKGLARRPRFKRKGRDTMNLCEPHPKTWRLDGGVLRFPKLGNLDVVVHRPVEGKAKKCTLVRDVDQWFAVISCEVDVADPPPHEGPAVGIDVGVAVAFADSTGHREPNPRFFASQARRLARAQREAARKKKGSKNKQKALIKVAKIHRKIRRQRDHFLHVQSKRYTKNHGVIVLEKLNVKGMTASASGSIEKPGTMVAQKRGLNRAILDVGWSRFAGFVRYKSTWAGGEVREVAAAFSSQTCSACGHCCAENRPSQAVFLCVNCGHEENADTNASKVICSRGTHGEAGCGGPVVGRPVKQQLRVVRRGSRHAGSGLDKASAFRPG
jgi:putative transposase